MIRTLILTVMLLALTGCSGTTTTTSELTAEQIVTHLTGQVPTATRTVTYTADTADTDPNDLLGRPRGYTSKTAFVDSRVNPGDVSDDREGSVDLGGSVEVFPNESDARKRKDYLDGLGPILAGGYNYLDGPVLLRVSRHLTPDQAAEYEAALGTAR